MEKTNETLQILNFISKFADEMAGLYIHIPFCKSRCIYCGFYSTVGLDLRQRYVDAVCREMELRGEWREVRGEGNDSNAEIETIYIGGGTPSQLTTAQLEQLFININKVYPLTSDMEVTIECNPDDVTVELAEALPRLTVNRVSMGAQTFDNDRLRFLHRRHTKEQVTQAVKRLRDAGIQNISIDLMYGFPQETIDDWQRDIEEALALDVEHISAYCLMIEEGTPLYEKVHKENRPLCVLSEELERAMYELLIDKLTAAGYEHYEISNFARPGYRSRHNSSYWHDVPYIGLGAAAHSMTKVHKGDGSLTEVKATSSSAFCVIRSWNVADIKQYIAAIERGERPAEGETLDDDTRYNDRIATALRTREGLNLRTLSEKHRCYCLKEAERYISDGLLRLEGNQLALTRKGLFVSDMVMSALIYV